VTERGAGSGRLAGLRRGRLPWVGDTSEHVAVVEQLLVVVDSVLLGGTVENSAATGDTLALSTGVRQVPVFVLARFEQRLVGDDLDRLALRLVVDLKMLDRLVGDRRRSPSTSTSTSSSVSSPSAPVGGPLPSDRDGFAARVVVRTRASTYTTRR